jgi:hypothetical protein
MVAGGEPVQALGFLWICRIGSPSLALQGSSPSASGGVRRCSDVEEATLGEQEPGTKTRGPGRRWRSTIASEPSAFLEGARQPGPGELAGIYRRLRKGREEAKNEPGAADFYYGECEMRRHARETPMAERWLLRAYWLVSGYGLRGLRALACLAVIIAGAALAFHAVGFARPPSPPGLSGSLLGSVALRLTQGMLKTQPQLIRWPWSARRTQSPHADSAASQRPVRSVRAERSG